MKKKRSVYNFILALTIGGVVVASSGVVTEVVLRGTQSSIVQEIQDDSSELFTLTQHCTGEDFDKTYNRALTQLENDRIDKKLDAIEYKTKRDYINSEQFKNEYMKSNFSGVYNNEILPLREKIETNKQKQENLEKIQNVAASLGIFGASCAAYSSAMLFGSKLDKEKEL